MDKKGVEKLLFFMKLFKVKDKITWALNNFIKDSLRKRGQ